MLSTAQVLEKATITADTIASTGAMNPEQANTFLDYVEDETSVGKIARVERFRPEQKYLDKLDVRDRVAVPKAEGIDPGVRRGVSSSRVTLEHHEVMCPFEIGDLFKQYNIEGDGGPDHVMRLFAKRFANNEEEIYWDGNTVGQARTEEFMVDGGSATGYVKDIYLAMFNGWLKHAESGHVLDAEGAAMSPTLLSKLIMSLPTKWRTNKSMLKFFASADHEQAYREVVSTRATTSGDNALAASGNLPAFGVELMPIPLLQPNPLYAENSVANNDGTTATALSYGPITDLVLTPSTLANVAVVPYILGTDYSVDEAAGTWTRIATGAISSGATVKATYNTAGKLVLTRPKNLIIAHGVDIGLEKQRNIYKGVWEYALTVQIFCQFEEVDAVAMLTNLAVPTA